MQWIAKLSLTLISAELESGPQGPMPVTREQFQFETREEAPGEGPEMALGPVCGRLDRWIEMVTGKPYKEPKEGN